MMNFELVLSNITKHISLNPEESKYFTSLLEGRFYKRKTTVHHEGDIARETYFVTQGCLKAFTIDKEGAEHILSFAPRDWWMGDLYSMISQQPGILNIETLADSHVLVLSRDNQEKLYETVPKFERFFRIIIEKSLVANQQRLINNMSLTAEERYLQFISKYPTIIEYTPQHNIASYLGITPEFLSKIRGRLAKKAL